MSHTKDQVQSRSPRIAAWRWSAVLGWRALRLVLSLVGVALVTFIGHAVFPVNATTVGFGYLLLVLIIASIWGFVDAALASIAATLTFNFFFLPPVGKFTIADLKALISEDQRLMEDRWGSMALK